MGPPSNLPDFEKLANDIAGGAGEAAKAPLDRFLGQLQHRGIPVHTRAASLLSNPDSQPKALHRELLKLFRTVDRVRIVTTNFDLHFQSAAQELFGGLPEHYRAPALPLGDRFNGIVHVHGALTHPRDLVLTDADFGRAYLTEGWARRFLVDVFRRYTVLFVGYSHDDVVMTYLARALPAEGVAGRFALTEKEGSWELLGITPVRFAVRNVGDPYMELELGVERLSEQLSRGVLDWQTRLTDLGEAPPPLDDEVVDEVEQALQEVHTTRFLLKAARNIGWPRWLHARKHLDTLFGNSILNERDKLLVEWLTEHFVLEHPDIIFELVAASGMRLNPRLWTSIALELGLQNAKKLSAATLDRWITILLRSPAPDVDLRNLIGLAQTCARQGAIALVLKVFLHLCQHRLILRSNSYYQDEPKTADAKPLEAECLLVDAAYSLAEIWSDHLKPNLEPIAQPLLAGLTGALEALHQDLVTWDSADRDWDETSYNRSAIEPHEQDRLPQDIDVLIDAVRDTLEWLITSKPTMVDAWLEMVNMAVPLLRRLAVHIIAVHPVRSADERINWILHQVGLAGTMEHHEVYRAVALNYPMASDAIRRSVVDAVLEIRVPEGFDWSAEKMTAWAHFEWLSWLLHAHPDCGFALDALEPIKAQYSDWEPTEYPDFTHWSSPTRTVGSQSPWPVEQLLATQPGAQLDQLLTFEGTRFFGPDRTGLLHAVAEASKRQISWAFRLLDALAEKSLNSSDLIAAALRGLQEAEMTASEWEILLGTVEKQGLHAWHRSEVARLLYGLVRDGGKPFAYDMLQRATPIALALWKSIETSESDEHEHAWLSRAISRPAGIIVEFWLNCLSLQMQGKTGADRNLPDSYKVWFKSVVLEPTAKGGYGRALLASQVVFLFGLDQNWTREQVLPLFTDSDVLRFAQAWDGFLAWGQLNQTLAAEMLPAFIPALTRFEGEARRRRRFMELYTELALFYAADATQELLPRLLEFGSIEDRVSFASNVGRFLRHMNSPAKQDLWNRWLRRYWSMRLQAIPVQLDPREIKPMLNWLPHLENLFPAGVELAVLAQPVSSDHNSLLLTLRESDLIQRFPEATAKLLIYLCDCVTDRYLIDELGKIARKVPALQRETDQRLQESLARVGAR